MPNIKLDKASQWWPLWLFLVTLPSLSIFMRYGLPMTHDGLTHLWRIMYLDSYVRSGAIYPRWLPDMLLGYGYPALNYYASGAYYLVEALHLLGFSLYNAFILAQCLLVLFAGGGMFMLARDTLDDVTDRPRFWPPFLAAVAYIYAPYLLINIYARGAIAELGAQMILPWLLWSFRRIWRAQQPNRYVLAAALTLASLALTHTISLLTVPPLLVAYVLLLGWRMPSWRPRLIATVIAIGAAMGISAFYWAPLIVERGYVSDIGFMIARVFMLPKSFYGWSDFLDTNLLYKAPIDPLWKLSLFQVTVAALGLLFALRRGREWRFWIGVLVVCALLMARIAEPLWQSTDILSIIQFPWRLLAIAQIPIALLFGLLLAQLRRRWLQAAAGLLLVILTVWVHLPRMDWEYILSPANDGFNRAIHAYFEAGRGKIIQGERANPAVQEFRPKWADESLQLDPATLDAESTASPATVTVDGASAFDTQLTVTNTEPFVLRLASYYFPGWRARIADPAAEQWRELSPYPSTNLGLLTLDIPAGTHTVTVEWRGTPIAHWAGIASLLFLLILGLWQLRQTGRRGLAAIPLAILAFSLIARMAQPQMRPLDRLDPAPQLDGLEIVGFHGPRLTNDGISIRPYWFVHSPQPPTIQIRWQLRDAAGIVVQQVQSAPYYDTYSTQNWPVNSLIDDAYLIPLPPGLSAGTYTVHMTILDDTNAPRFDTTLGSVEIPKPTPVPTPETIKSAYFGDHVQLVGLDFNIVERLIGQPDERLQQPDRQADLPIAHTGDTLTYVLYWQTDAEIDEPYVGFIHLVDHLGRPIDQSDHSPGPLLNPVAVWTPYGTYADRYLLHIPPDVPSGLYWPHVGMYIWPEEDRFDVRLPDSNTPNDHLTLDPIKIINPHLRPAGERIDAAFANLADLLRFQIDGGPTTTQDGQVTVQPGSTFTLTAYYQVEQTTSAALRRFVQVRDQANRIIAQEDGEPQDGQNPTWAWQPGEIVRDPIPLTLPADTPAGEYTLYLGFYDPARDLERIEVVAGDGTAFPNREVPLTQLLIPSP